MSRDEDLNDPIYTLCNAFSSTFTLHRTNYVTDLEFLLFINLPIMITSHSLHLDMNFKYEILNFKII